MLRLILALHSGISPVGLQETMLGLRIKSGSRLQRKTSILTAVLSLWHLLYWFLLGLKVSYPTRKLTHASRLHFIVPHGIGSCPGS